MQSDGLAAFYSGIKNRIVLKRMSEYEKHPNTQYNFRLCLYLRETINFARTLGETDRLTGYEGRDFERRL